MTVEDAAFWKLQTIARMAATLRQHTNALEAATDAIYLYEIVEASLATPKESQP